MAIVTLTTDWNKSDYYLGAVKGRLLGLDPSIQVVDITHQVSPFNIGQAAYIVKQASRHFPPNSIHLIDVKNEPGKSGSYLCMFYNGQYYLSADNGLLSLLVEEDLAQFYTIESKTKENLVFAALELFCPAIKEIIGSGVEALCLAPVKEIEKRMPIMPAIDSNTINGSVLYIDSFGNAHTNISRELFNQEGKQRAFEIIIQSNYNKINQVSINYGHAQPGELVAVFNSANVLEIAINNGNAAQLLNLSPNSNVRVKFIDSASSVPEIKLFNN
ncbi:MAG: SAM-dependent chlorinase/fluorinase [Bacteroidales bacterium]|nr:SAM-dependent chlorinase/fluorinase [Bacteroidales bacterium]